MNPPLTLNACLTQADECRRAGDIAKAVELYRSATIVDPSSIIAWANLATGLNLLHKTAEANVACEQGLQRDPNHAVLLITLGTLHEQAGDTVAARQAYQSAVTHNNRHVPALIALAVFLAGIGNTVEAQARFTDALHLDPANRAAWYGLGVLLRANNLLDDAIRCFEKVLALQGGRIDALVNCAETWQTAGFLNTAQHYLQAALALAPDNRLVKSNWLVLTNYLPAMTPQQIAREHLAHPANYAGQTVHRTIKRSSGPLRIGYVSPDFCLHPAASFLMPLIESHDQQSFEVICFPTLSRSDATTGRFKKSADEWHCLAGMSSAQATSTIRDRNIDILIDCAGHLEGNRLDIFEHRAAPVQASFIGYPNTTGCREMDYFITDKHCDPAGSDVLFSEKVIRLSGCFCAYEPLLNLPEIKPAPRANVNHITFGSLHTLARLNDPVLKLWAQVLNKVANSRIIICRTTLSPMAKKRIADIFQTQGVERGRIEFISDLAGYNGHLDVYNSIDIALDTFPWSGHTTACEALLMGVITITLRGNRHAGRMVSSVLTCAGFPELIAADETAFVAVAQSLAAQGSIGIDSRQHIRDTMLASALCDGQTYTKTVEQAYRAMVVSA